MDATIQYHKTAKKRGRAMLGIFTKIDVVGSYHELGGK